MTKVDEQSTQGGLKAGSLGHPARGSEKGREREHLPDPGRTLDEFLRSVERQAFRMAQLATQNPEDALDVVQDSMLKLVEAYGTRSSAEWKPLFYRILHNRISDWHRWNWVRTHWRVWLHTGNSSHEDEETTTWETLPDMVTPDAAVQLGQKRATQALYKALRVLPFRQRQTFLLRAWEGLTVAETAQAMGCSSGSVKTHYSRAIHTLKLALSEHDQ